MTTAYLPLKKSRTTYCEVGGLRIGVREWGPANGTLLVLLHGSRDTSWTFQFLVDALADGWRIIAPDWRGHGLTPAGTQSYWFHELLADLDGLLSFFAPQQAVALVGHSLGGNIASVYAGLRPDRVSRMVSLDAFGLLEPGPAKLAETLSQWLQPRPPGQRPALRAYASLDEMARRLLDSNPRLTAEKALFLARQSSRPCEGGFCWQFPSGARRSLPTLHALDEWAECWSRITAPAMWIAASDPRAGTVTADPEASAKVMQALRDRSLMRLADTGHNLHHDAPVQLAAILDGFLPLTLGS